MIVYQEKENARIDRKFPYCIKPSICRIQDVKKQDVNNKMIYIKCNSCVGIVEIWNDEKTGYCLNCGKMHATILPNSIM